MAQQFTIISYGPADPGHLDRLLVRRFDHGQPIRGYDHFLYLTDESRRFYGIIESGEANLVEDGFKSSLKEVNVRTYVEPGTIGPDVIVQYRAPDDEEWSSVSDETGTITVTPTGCTGSGTVFSNRIGTGDGAETVFNTPVPAVLCRIYLGTTLVPQVGNYTITGTRQITFVVAPGNGIVVYARWSNEPPVRAKVGDYIETTEGFHRINRILDAWTLQLSWYPTETLVGKHRMGKPTVMGDHEVAYALPVVIETIQFRILFIPRNTSESASVAKVTGILLVHVPSGPRQRMES